MSSAQALVGSTVLGEFRLDAVAYADDALWVYRAASVVDGGAYAVVVPREVAVETSASALAEAVTRASQHAIGQRATLALLAARTVDVAGAPRVAAVRRGDPGVSILDELRGPRPLAEIVAALAPAAAALEALHDQGVCHGALSPAALVFRDGKLVLDWFGLAMAAEVASGARGAKALLSRDYAPPEVAGASLPGAYSDAWAFAKLALVLLVGPEEARTQLSDIGLAPPVEDVFRLALAASPASRPGPKAFLDALERASKAPEPRASTRTAPTPGPVGAPPAGAGPDIRDTLRDEAPPSMPPPSISPAGQGTKTLAIGIAIALGVLMIVVGGALAWSLTSSPTPAASATATATTAGPKPPHSPPTGTATGSAPAPAATLNLTSSLRTGSPSYPQDADALVPVPAGSAVRGTRDASVTLVLAGSLTCDLTAKELAVIPALEANYGSDLRVVWLYAGSVTDAAEESVALASLGVLDRAGATEFWRFVELTAGSKPDAGRLEELGIKAGAPAGAVTTAVSTKAGHARLAREVEVAARLAVRATPTMFVNGVRIDGYRSYSTLVTIIDEELRRTKALRARGVAIDKVYATRVTANVTTSEGEKRYGTP